MKLDILRWGAEIRTGFHFLKTLMWGFRQRASILRVYFRFLCVVFLQSTDLLSPIPGVLPFAPGFDFSFHA
jgi:hypothetical protein